MLYNKNYYRFGLAITALTIVIALASYAILTGLTPIGPDNNIITILLALNAIFITLLISIIILQLYKIIQNRSRGKAGARLHIQLIGFFSIAAAIPAIIVAIFAGITLDKGLDSWFADKTKNIINNAKNVAERYLEEHANVIRGDLSYLAFVVNQNSQYLSSDIDAFQRFLGSSTAWLGLNALFLINDKSEIYIHVISEASNIKYSPPPPQAIEGANKLANTNGIVIINPDSNNIVKALVKINSLKNSYLYVFRFVDPEVLEHLKEARSNSDEYHNMELGRAKTQITFALIYIGLVAILILAAIWFGIAVASRLAEPIADLILAADRLAPGEMGIKVLSYDKAGDIGILTNSFNYMSTNLEEQRRNLEAINDTLGQRNSFIETVLYGINSGVVSIDNACNIALINASAKKILGIFNNNIDYTKKFIETFPEFEKLYNKLQNNNNDLVEDHIKIKVLDKNLVLYARASNNFDTDSEHNIINYGCVFTFDDITDLISAQRMSAWSDIARRIAHEIKNPLTPIQLSAERLQRKYGKNFGQDDDIFMKCTNTIISQVDNIGRMVNEFSSFARMPSASLQYNNFVDIVKESIFLYKMNDESIQIEFEFENDNIKAFVDKQLISQALTNIIKNSIEAIITRKQNAKKNGLEEVAGKISISLTTQKQKIILLIKDNGGGFDQEIANNLFEPYITTKTDGVGVGLSIVAKIIDEHGGSISMFNINSDSIDKGMCVSIELPLAPSS